MAEKRSDIPSADLLSVIVREAMAAVTSASLNQWSVCICDINTGKAYELFDKSGKNHTPDKLGMLCALQNKSLAEICERLENVFEQFIDVPQRIEIKNTLRKHNALGACMSGSGPTVYGIFESKDDAQAAFEELNDEYRQVFLCSPARTGCRVDKIIE